MTNRKLPFFAAATVGLVLGGMSAQALTNNALPKTGASATAYSAKALKDIDILGVKIGMTLPDAKRLLEQRGMLPNQPYPRPYPDARRAGAIRFTTNRALPVIDLTFHLVRGRMAVTEINADEYFFVSLDAADRIVRQNFGEPTKWETTLLGSRAYSWNDRRWPSDPNELLATNSCLQVHNSCLEPGVPNNCPAKLIHKGTELTARLVANPSDRWSLHLRLRDTSAQVATLCHGQAQLPFRATCLPPLS